ncbi:MarR family winged helix-turn-helix transcriptional regulator [Methylocella sp.]|uniref:MarR family winged helix-turn-helix transcriptional regulator n=1 Tax=Methylocella sp. TaxID=1978226 RepID=UPI0035B09FB5
MAVTRLFKPTLDRLGITYPQYLVLHALWEQDGRSVRAIAERLALESSTVTPLLKRLEAAGLVTRARNPDDEREVEARLTAAGRALRGRCGRLAQELTERSGLSMDELGALNRHVQVLRDALARERP